MDAQIINKTRGLVLADNAFLANTLWTRLKGLLGTSSLEEGHGLVLDPCNSIHTWFMAYDIDVLFLDKDGAVVQVFESFAPWKMTRIYAKSKRVVELPGGALAGTGTAIGDVIDSVPV